MNSAHMKTLLVIVISLLCCSTLQAHQLSTGYINVMPLDNSEQSRIDVQLRWFDLDSAIGIDQNLDGELRWQEVLDAQNSIVSYLTQHLNIRASATNLRCTLTQVGPIRTTSHFNEGYGVLSFDSQCGVQDGLLIKYSAVFKQNKEHKLLLNAEDNVGQHYSAVLSEVQSTWQLDSQGSSIWSTLKTYTYQGVVHIFIGIDHILFLLALLLTCVLSREGKKWVAKVKVKDVFVTTAWLVTAFTLAHSVTLTATALDWIAPNSRYVELGIAISVLLTALNNVFAIVTRLAWLTFGFGLLHGMGFASVLGELGLDSQHTLVSVVAFNLGVEFGQLAILALILPVLLWLRHFALYRVYGVRMGSLAIAAMALHWSIERF